MAEWMEFSFQGFFLERMFLGYTQMCSHTHTHTASNTIQTLMGSSVGYSAQGQLLFAIEGSFLFSLSGYLSASLQMCVLVCIYIGFTSQ